ncbi:unnamed protein product [Amoebophrya sp. A25]|nr:unnamed protein product [Amoebophrya sp. A25]|eukprot:GSA25T00022523001.1
MGGITSFMGDDSSAVAENWGGGTQGWGGGNQGSWDNWNQQGWGTWGQQGGQQQQAHRATQSGNAKGSAAGAKKQSAKSKEAAKKRPAGRATTTQKGGAGGAAAKARGKAKAKAGGKTKVDPRKTAVKGTRSTRRGEGQAAPLEEGDLAMESGSEEEVFDSESDIDETNEAGGFWDGVMEFFYGTNRVAPKASTQRRSRRQEGAASDPLLSGDIVEGSDDEQQYYTENLEESRLLEYRNAFSLQGIPEKVTFTKEDVEGAFGAFGMSPSMDSPSKEPLAALDFLLRIGVSVDPAELEEGYALSPIGRLRGEGSMSPEDRRAVVGAFNLSDIASSPGSRAARSPEDAAAISRLVQAARRSAEGPEMVAELFAYTLRQLADGTQQRRPTGSLLLLASNNSTTGGTVRAATLLRSAQEACAPVSDWGARLESITNEVLAEYDENVEGMKTGSAAVGPRTFDAQVAWLFMLRLRDLAPALAAYQKASSSSQNVPADQGARAQQELTRRFSSFLAGLRNESAGGVGSRRDVLSRMCSALAEHAAGTAESFYTQLLRCVRTAYYALTSTERATTAGADFLYRGERVFVSTVADLALFLRRELRGLRRMELLLGMEFGFPGPRSLGELCESVPEEVFFMTGYHDPVESLQRRILLALDFELQFDHLVAMAEQLEEEAEEAREAERAAVRVSTGGRQTTTSSVAEFAKHGSIGTKTGNPGGTGSSGGSGATGPSPGRNPNHASTPSRSVPAAALASRTMSAGTGSSSMQPARAAPLHQPQVPGESSSRGLLLSGRGLVLSPPDSVGGIGPLGGGGIGALPSVPAPGARGSSAAVFPGGAAPTGAAGGAAPVSTLSNSSASSQNGTTSPGGRRRNRAQAVKRDWTNEEELLIAQSVAELVSSVYGEAYVREAIATKDPPGAGPPRETIAPTTLVGGAAASSSSSSSAFPPPQGGPMAARLNSPAGVVRAPRGEPRASARIEEHSLGGREEDDTDDTRQRASGDLRTLVLKSLGTRRGDQPPGAPRTPPQGLAMEPHVAGITPGTSRVPPVGAQVTPTLSSLLSTGPGVPRRRDRLPASMITSSATETTTDSSLFVCEHEDEDNMGNTTTPTRPGGKMKHIVVPLPPHPSTSTSLPVDPVSVNEGTQKTERRRNQSKDNSSGKIFLLPTRGKMATESVPLSLSGHERTELGSRVAPQLTEPSSFAGASARARGGSPSFHSTVFSPTGSMHDATTQDNTTTSSIWSTAEHHQRRHQPQPMRGATPASVFRELLAPGGAPAPGAGTSPAPGAGTAPARNAGVDPPRSPRVVYPHPTDHEKDDRNLNAYLTRRLMRDQQGTATASSTSTSALMSGSGQAGELSGLSIEPSSTSASTRPGRGGKAEGEVDPPKTQSQTENTGEVQETGTSGAPGEDNTAGSPADSGFAFHTPDSTKRTDMSRGHATRSYSSNLPQMAEEDEQGQEDFAGSGAPVPPIALPPSESDRQQVSSQILQSQGSMISPGGALPSSYAGMASSSSSSYPEMALPLPTSGSPGIHMASAQSAVPHPLPAIGGPPSSDVGRVQWNEEVDVTAYVNEVDKHALFWNIEQLRRCITWEDRMELLAIREELERAHSEERGRLKRREELLVAQERAALLSKAREIIRDLNLSREFQTLLEEEGTAPERAAPGFGRTDSEGTEVEQANTEGQQQAQELATARELHQTSGAAGMQGQEVQLHQGAPGEPQQSSASSSSSSAGSSSSSSQPRS